MQSQINRFCESLKNPNLNSLTFVEENAIPYILDILTREVKTNSSPNKCLVNYPVCDLLQALHDYRIPFRSDSIPRVIDQINQSIGCRYPFRVCLFSPSDNYSSQTSFIQVYQIEKKSN